VLAAQALLGVVAGVFVFSGLVKLLSPNELAMALRELLPGGHKLRTSLPPVLRGLTVFVALVELATALSHLAFWFYPSPVFLLPSVFVSAGILMVGVVGMIRSPQRDCGCFGSITNGPLGVRQLFVGMSLVACTLVPWFYMARGDHTNGAPSLYILALGVVAFTKVFWHLRPLIPLSLIALKRTWM